MSVRKIQAAIARLPAQELAKLMTRLEEYHARVWDKEIEDDMEAGRRDGLLAEVAGEHEAGLSQPL